jgi:thymidylate synthase (FAD)|nr:MAG TPA: Thymidylate synthase complementing protein [Crassvirales sp.]
MKLIKPSFEIWNQPAGLEGVYKQIERVGRVCYKSEDKITEDSAKPFVDRMVKSGHGAMLEHGTVYMLVPFETHSGKYKHNKYSKVCDIAKSEMGDRSAVTTNLRVLVENGWMDDLQYLCEPTEFHEKRITVHFVCDRGVSHEFVRHRVMSFAQESTRYCNYSKDKFGNELTFIIPEWCPEIREDSNKGWDPCSMYDKLYLQHLQSAEDTYFALLKQWDERVPDKRYKSGFRNNPWMPQQARAVLPNSLKTELVVTGFVSDWNHFFDLRARGTTGAPHPQAKELAEPLMEEFIARKYINN